MEAKSYQTELYQMAKDNNVIIKLNTGSGKTFIASMLMQDYLNQSGGKKIFFLVKNASLAQQHTVYLRQYLFLKNEVGFFHGNMNNSWVDFWTKDKWAVEIAKYRIIIMTAKVFLDILNHNKYSLNQICLLIFDEVHHLSKADDYVQISEHLIGNKLDIRLLGLTACLVKTVKKVSDIEYLIEEMERRLHCKIVTSLDSIANEFSANIKNIYVDFENVISEEVESLLEILRFSLAKIQAMDVATENEYRNTSTTPEFIVEDNPFISLKRYITDISSVLTTLGIIPCNCIVDIFLNDLRTLSNGSQFLIEKNRIALSEFSTCLEKFKEKSNLILKKATRLKCSVKTIKLIQFIRNLNSELKNGDKDNYILIFITERIHALALNEFLILLPKINKEFSFIKSEFIIGHTTCTYPKKLEMNGTEQNNILNRFRERVFNILVATNVVEEGLDIPHCNVVIKFDPPCEFRSYIQSKGRARASNSQYIIFEKAERIGMIKVRINLFDQINKIINESLKTRAIENYFLDDNTSENEFYIDSYKMDYMPYGKSGPRITLNSAAGVLNRYTGKLRCNCLSEIKIMYKIIQNSSNLFETSLLLPMPSPYLEEIKGGFHSNKKLSRQFAQLEACKILHKLDELDGNLLPYNRFEDDDEDDVKTSQKSIGLIYYRKYIANKLCSDFQNLSDSTEFLYLYSIRYSPQVFLKLGIEDLSGFDLSSSIGILLSKPIHQVKVLTKFPIYLVGGQCTASIIFEEKVPITQKQLKVFLNCHEILFKLYAQRIRKFEPNIRFLPIESQCSLIITILKNFKIDFETIETIIKKKLVVKLSEYPQSSWKGSVIRPTHLKREFGAYTVTNVCENMNSHSKLKNCDIDFKSYYKKQYGITLTEEEAERPLISVTRLTTIQSCTNKEKRSLKESKRLQRINQSNIYFIPSLTECISLSSSLWTYLCIFPTIQLRLNQILILREFTTTVDFIEISESKNTFEVDFDKCYNIKNLTSTHLDLDDVTFVNNIFPCFVAKMCNDRLDLEQYEILGDSFLKFITTKYLYHFSAFTDNEGKLTNLRSKLISNKKLFELAKKKDLSKYLFVSNFDPKVNYLPPNFVVNLSDKDTIERNERENVVYKNKCLADCVEALIGSILTNYGMDYAVKFLLWMDMELLPESYEHGIEVVATAPVCLYRNLTFDSIPENISELETILKYKFNHPAYAVQAITHPTSIENRKFSCYQRLEFLGDAILDFLVTSHIMVHKSDMRPGKITNLRSALVSNSTFAFLSVKWELYKFLNYFDPKMFFALPKVVESILENNLDINTSFLKKSEQHKVIVKVLGDIFESIAGAIFVDSNYDIEAVWTVYKRLMEEPLKAFSDHVPKNKISLLYERFPGLRCHYEVEEGTNLTILTATLSDGRVLEVKERNKTICKLTLAEELLP